MNSRERAQAVLLRKQLLLLRSAELRLSLAEQSQLLQPPLAVADQVRAAGRWLRAHPEGPMAAALLLGLMRPRRALRWGTRLWSGWRLWQRARHWLAAAPQPGR